jgi:hypothetical protein
MVQDAQRKKFRDALARPALDQDDDGPFNSH